MANKLKDLFSEQQDLFIGTFTFNSEDDKKIFVKKLQQLLVDGKPYTEHSISQFTMKEKNGNNYYPISRNNCVDDVILEVPVKIIEINISYDDKNEEYTLLAKNLRDYFLFENKNSKIVKFQIKLYKDSNKVNLSYNWSREKAESFQELISEFKRASAFLDAIFDNKKITRQIKNLKFELKRCCVEFEIWKEAAQLLNIELKPNEIKLDNEQDYILEKVYIWLKEKKPIKQNVKLNYIEDINLDTSKFEIGQTIMATNIDEVKLNVYGNNIVIYVVTCSFNAHISEIVNEKDKTRILFKDSDSCPMYTSELGFLTMDEAKTELKRVMDHVDDYKNATYIYECVNQWDNKVKI